MASVICLPALHRPVCLINTCQWVMLECIITDRTLNTQDPSISACVLVSCRVIYTCLRCTSVLLMNVAQMMDQWVAVLCACE